MAVERRNSTQGEKGQTENYSTGLDTGKCKDGALTELGKESRQNRFDQVIFEMCDGSFYLSTWGGYF